jgi:hypothetical protein
MRTGHIITEAIISILIALWCFTFVSKIVDFETFNRQIKGAYLLSALGTFLPYFLQCLHLVIIILLINKRLKKYGLLASLNVLTLYTAYLVYVLKFAPSVPCSCIAVLRGMNWTDQLYFNFVALAINITGLIMLSHKRPPHRSHIQTHYH